MARKTLAGLRDMESPPDTYRPAEPTPSGGPSMRPLIAVTHKISGDAYEVLTPIDSIRGRVEAKIDVELGASENQIISSEVVTIFIHWWGYEIALPPPALAKLERARSIQQTFFWFLQGFIAAGGAPELAPFVRYISSFLDLEWSAIKGQDRGNGVVLAATWLVPALVPRPWDFAASMPSQI
ncbi:hypothetical protein B0A53_03744 [Rhodotorula sp. CCFEE 5036]|nr:hypothetical protein B0A53_03744 [Rhodotorula sp. CCFEE 5036]